MIAILAFLQNNWKMIAVLFLITALYGAGRYQGVQSEKRVCEAILQEARDQKQAEKDKLQADADAKAKAYEVLKAQSEKNINDVKRRLDDAIRSNSAFLSCHAGPQFLLLYSETVRACSRGDSACKLDITLQGSR